MLHKLLSMSLKSLGEERSVVSEGLNREVYEEYEFRLESETSRRINLAYLFSRFVDWVTNTKDSKGYTYTLCSEQRLTLLKPM